MTRRALTFHGITKTAGTICLSLGTIWCLRGITAGAPIVYGIGIVVIITGFWCLEVEMVRP